MTTINRPVIRRFQPLTHMHIQIMIHRDRQKVGRTDKQIYAALELPNKKLSMKKKYISGPKIKVNKGRD